MENLEILKGIVSDETYAALEAETKDSKIRLGDLSTDKYVSADKYKDLEKQLGRSTAHWPRKQPNTIPSRKKRATTIF